MAMDRGGDAWLEQSRAEQSRAEQSRAEQSRAEAGPAAPADDLPPLTLESLEERIVEVEWLGEAVRELRADVDQLRTDFVMLYGRVEKLTGR